MSKVVCAWEMSDRWGAIVEIFCTQSSRPLGEMAVSSIGLESSVSKTHNCSKYFSKMNTTAHTFLLAQYGSGLYFIFCDFIILCSSILSVHAILSQQHSKPP